VASNPEHQQFAPASAQDPEMSEAMVARDQSIDKVLDLYGKSRLGEEKAMKK